MYLPATILNNPNADIILRTADKLVYKTRNVHLQSSSTVFDDMLSSPDIGTVGVRIGNFPIIDLPELSTTLRPFLRFILPKTRRRRQEDSPATFHDLVQYLSLMLFPHSLVLSSYRTLPLNMYVSPSIESSMSPPSTIRHAPLTLPSSTCKDIVTFILARFSLSLSKMTNSNSPEEPGNPSTSMDLWPIRRTALFQTSFFTRYHRTY